jgi:hypothetical protein
MVLYLTHFTFIRFVSTYKTQNSPKVYTKSGTESKIVSNPEKYGYGFFEWIRRICEFMRVMRVLYPFVFGDCDPDGDIEGEEDDEEDDVFPVGAGVASGFEVAAVKHHHRAAGAATGRAP